MGLAKRHKSLIRASGAIQALACVCVAAVRVPIPPVPVLDIALVYVQLKSGLLKDVQIELLATNSRRPNSG